MNPKLEGLVVETPEPRRATVPEVVTFWKKGLAKEQARPSGKVRPPLLLPDASPALQELARRTNELEQDVINDRERQRRWNVATRTSEIQLGMAIPWKEEMQRWLREELHTERAELTKLTADAVRLLQDLNALTTHLVEQGYRLERP